MDCPYCKATIEPTIEIRTTGKHYANMICPQCNRHLGFAPKPDSDASKYNRPAQHRELVRKHSRGYCELCRFTESQLPKNCSLEAHHVIPFEEGGEPTRDNTWILCTACHRLVEWQRTYRGQLLKSVADSLERWKTN